MKRLDSFRPTHAAFKSAVFESEEYESIVDTGTTVTIEPKTDSPQRVDPRERIKISGFDGHVTQSLGVARGTVAFGTNRSGASIRLKMPTQGRGKPRVFRVLPFWPLRGD